MFRIALLLLTFVVVPLAADARGRPPMATVRGLAHQYRAEMTERLVSRCTPEVETAAGPIDYLLWNPGAGTHEYRNPRGYARTHDCSWSRVIIGVRTVDGRWVQGYLSSYDETNGLAYIVTQDREPHQYGLAGWDPEQPNIMIVLPRRT